MELPFNIDLSDKVCVISAGGGVLLSEFARAVSQCGAKVALLDIDYEAANKVATEIGLDKAIAIKTNCLDKVSLENALDVVHKKFGAVNILINGCGGNSPKGTTENETMDPSMLDKEMKDFFSIDENGLKFVFDLNMTAVMLTTQVFAKDMVKTGGNILNLSSMGAIRPLTKVPTYSAAKAAISNFTQWLAVHFAPCNIRVNALAPGWFSTKQNQALLWNPDGTLSERSKKVINGTPMKRFGKPSELIGTVLWLLSDKASSFVTGAIIPVDGGFSAYSGV
jgi:NAD(P)-dependent dehydrogenase (short-subunit alcohol dehydrogenase family)